MSATDTADRHGELTAVLTLDDFITGLLAGLAARGVKVISIRDDEFYSAIEDTYRLLADRADELSIELLFHVAVNRVYRDSPDVREAITRAVQRDLVGLDNPEYQDMRLKVSAAGANGYLENLPGGPSLYLELAKRFQDHYGGE